MVWYNIVLKIITDQHKLVHGEVVHSRATITKVRHSPFPVEQTIHAVVTKLIDVVYMHCCRDRLGVRVASFSVTLQEQFDKDKIVLSSSLDNSMERVNALRKLHFFLILGVVIGLQIQAVAKVYDIS